MTVKKKKKEKKERYVIQPDAYLFCIFNSIVHIEISFKSGLEQCHFPVAGRLPELASISAMSGL